MDGQFWLLCNFLFYIGLMRHINYFVLYTYIYVRNLLSAGYNYFINEANQCETLHINKTDLFCDVFGIDISSGENLNMYCLV